MLCVVVLSAISPCMVLLRWNVQGSFLSFETLSGFDEPLKPNKQELL